MLIVIFVFLGCIRLWDISSSTNIGQVILQLNDDIGTFSLGDISRNEKPLAVSVFFIFYLIVTLSNDTPNQWNMCR